jgi:hypothetical protein
LGGGKRESREITVGLTMLGIPSAQWSLYSHAIQTFHHCHENELLFQNINNPVIYYVRRFFFNEKRKGETWLARPL